MMKKLSILAFTAALLLPAASVQAATVAIGGTSLTLVYDPVTDTLCDVAGCDYFDSTGNLADATELSALAFTIDGSLAGLLANGLGDTIYVDVQLDLGDFQPVLGFFAAPITGGIVDFYTFGPDGDNFLQLNVVGGNVTYGLNGETSVTAATSNSLYDQLLNYSFGNLVFTDPDIGWAYSAPSSTGSLEAGFTTNSGTPDWSDDSVEFDTPVPEPGSMLLLGSGLMGLAASARRRLRRKDQ